MCLCERPYVMAIYSRQLRKFAASRLRISAITEERHEQFARKTQTLGPLTAMILVAEEDEDFCFKDIQDWIQKNWNVLLGTADDFNDIPDRAPMMFRNAAPANKGRRARREMPTPYDQTPEFLADKELFLWEQNEESTP